MSSSPSSTLTLLLGTIAVLLPVPAAFSADPTNADLLKIIKEQGAKIARLESQMKAQPAVAPAAAKKEKASAKKKGGRAEGAIDTALKPTNGQSTNLKTISEAFDVPNSPAAAVLGISPDKVQHLKTPKQLVPALINGLDDKGHFQSGLAVDFAPYQWWRDKQNIEDLRYHKDEGMEKALSVWLQRILVRTQISFATTKGSSDADKSSKFALGIHSVIANSDDPVNFAAPETVRGDKAVPDDADGLLNRRGRKLNAWVPVLGERVDRHDVPFDRDGLFAKAGNYFFNHVSWAVGAAPTWIAEGDGGHYEYSGMTAWSSFAYVPSEQTPVRFLLDAIYHEGEKIAATDAISPPPAVAGKKPGQIKQDSLLLTGGVNFGTRDFHATVTATYLGLDQYDFGSDSAFRYAIALEKRVTNNAWITLTLSKDDGHKDGKNPTLVLGGVKIGLGGTDFNAEDLRNIVE